MGDISQWWKNPHLPKTVHLVHGCGIVWQKQSLFAYSPKFKARSWECMRRSKPSIWCQQRKRVHRVHEWGERLVWARTAPPRWRPSHIPDKPPLVDLFPLSSFLFTCSLFFHSTSPRLAPTCTSCHFFRRLSSDSLPQFCSRGSHVSGTQFLLSHSG